MEKQGSAHLDARRKQMLYRASHRGIKEMDIILGAFAAANIGLLAPERLDALEKLMSETDRDLLTWFTGEQPVPADIDREMFEAISAFQANSVA